MGCGAWSAPLLLVTYFSSSDMLGWSIAFYALALVFNYPHYMATVYRAYRSAEDVEKYRLFTIHATGLIALTLLISHFYFRLLPLIFTIYLTWSPWHYSGQNYGLFMMFARRAGAQPSNTARDALYGAFITSYLILFLSFHTGPSSDPLFVSLGIPVFVATWMKAIAAVAFLGCSGYGLYSLSRQVSMRRLFPALTLFSTQFIWFLLPGALAAWKGWNVPQSRYSTGIFAVMHSAQYLWITSYYARREASTRAGSWRPVVYFGVLIVGGILLFVPGPWLASYVFHYDWTASFLIFTALVNIHHFILDGVIWKLRDSRIAQLLLNSTQGPPASSVADRELARWREWIGAVSRRSRAVRIGAVAVVILWAGVDQVRYALSLHQDNLQNLRHAALLNPFDSAVQMRLARAEAGAGNPEKSSASWKRAMAVNPANPGPRNGYLKYLLEEKRLGEAYELTSAALTRSPKDADLLVNHGILAVQTGQSVEAVKAFESAIALDPSQQNAHLYLAHELARQGKPDAAIPHYMLFLSRIAKAGSANAPPAEQIVPVILELASAQAKAGRGEQAIMSYHLAEDLALKAGSKKLESLAAAGEAETQANAGNVRNALRAYQRTLRLDGALDDRRNEAIDWYNYALFLREHKFSERLVEACLLRSESLLKEGSSAPELAKVSAQIRNSKNDATVAQLRKNLRPALDEALALTE